MMVMPWLVLQVVMLVLLVLAVKKLSPVWGDPLPQLNRQKHEALVAMLKLLMMVVAAAMVVATAMAHMTGRTGRQLAGTNNGK
jgi:uncharacterized membrane protein